MQPQGGVGSPCSASTVEGSIIGKEFKRGSMMFHNGLLDDKPGCQVLDQSATERARVPTVISTDSGFTTVTVPRFYGVILACSITIPRS